MKKLLYVLPHCSTGGMPQYVLKQIQGFKDRFDIYVLEVSFAGPDFVVQREAIGNLVRFSSLYGKTEKLEDVIKYFKPNIIHFQELPETFLPDDIIADIYNDASIFTLVTTHSSLTKPADFRFRPDRIVTVNRWQTQQLEPVGCSMSMWEYPIESKISRGKYHMKTLMDFDFKRPAILNVGLFTPGKNQGELFEVARKNPDNDYHFIGNQAPNFRDYWEPLMKNKPDNCIVWGERTDVDMFYQAADEFYFTSKFELNPLVVKEALSWRLPVKMYKLPTYLDDYDNNPLVTYL